MSQIEKVLNFAKFLTLFRKVERAVYYSHDTRPENDAEHSWQLAMVARYIISLYQLDLQLEKVFKYCLVHDLVEIYAGDVYAYTDNLEAKAKKKEKEEQALEKITQEFTEFPEMSQLIRAYEWRVDEESKFVYALDKMMPDLNIASDNGHGRHKVDAHYEKMRAYKDHKIAIHPTTHELYQEFLAYVEPHKENRFPKEETK